MYYPRFIDSYLAERFESYVEINFEKQASRPGGKRSRLPRTDLSALRYLANGLHAESLRLVTSTPRKGIKRGIECIIIITIAI